MAFGNSTFSDAAGAVGDLFASAGHSVKAKGDEIEAQNYDLASSLAEQNRDYTIQSTAIKQMQLDRQIFQTQGTAEATIGANGLQMSGSAVDVLRDSASQGSLTKAVLSEQGYITEAGYQEQADSYKNMAAAARAAADAENNASIGSAITGAIKGAASLATLFI